MANPQSVSTLRVGNTATPRLISLSNERYREGGAIISGTYSRDPLNTSDIDYLRAGLVMGKRTTGSKFAPSIIGVLASAYDKDGSYDEVMTVSVATATEIVRRIGATGSFNVTGPPSAAGTVVTEEVTYSAVNVTTGAITVTAAAADYISGSFIQDTDGSETPLCLIANGYPLKVTNDNDASIDIDFAKMLIGGRLDASQIINYPSDTSLITWIKGNLNGTGNTVKGRSPFSFDDDV